MNEKYYNDYIERVSFKYDSGIWQQPHLSKPQNSLKENLREEYRKRYGVQAPTTMTDSELFYYVNKELA